MNVMIAISKSGTLCPNTVRPNTSLGFGHGTVVDDLLGAVWTDWTAEVARAHDRLADRVDDVVLVGQRMGATLALWAALRRSDVAGVVCINPLTVPRQPDEIALIDELIDDGLTIAPGTGSDIADPDASDITYDGTPLRAVRSLLVDGVDRFLLRKIERAAERRGGRWL